MIKYVTVLIFCLLILQSCEENETEPTSKLSDENKSEMVQTEEQKSEVEEPYTPYVDNIVAQIEGGRYYTEDKVRGRDADYYNCYVKSDKHYEINLESSNERLNIIIVPDDGEKILSEDTGNEGVHWKGQFPTTGNTLIVVSLATDASQDSNIAEYTLEIIEK